MIIPFALVVVKMEVTELGNVAIKIVAYRFEPSIVGQSRVTNINANADIGLVRIVSKLFQNSFKAQAGVKEVL